MSPLDVPVIIMAAFANSDTRGPRVRARRGLLDKPLKMEELRAFGARPGPERIR